MLESNHPKFKSKKGFAQISQASKVIDISSLNVGDEFMAQSDEVSISAKVIKKENII
jgi:exodeoxyribonuclease VII large subunit